MNHEQRQYRTFVTVPLNPSTLSMSHQSGMHASISEERADKQVKQTRL